MGETTDEEKKFFTLVLKGHLHLGNAHWKYGCTGANLDYLAREPLWQENMDYNHGTGHGVGYVLSVHEGPQRIHWRGAPIPLEPGMVTSDRTAVLSGGTDVTVRTATETVRTVGRRGGTERKRRSYVVRFPFRHVYYVTYRTSTVGRFRYVLGTVGYGCTGTLRFSLVVR